MRRGFDLSSIIENRVSYVCLHLPHGRQAPFSFCSSCSSRSPFARPGLRLWEVWLYSDRNSPLNDFAALSLQCLAKGWKGEQSPPCLHGAVPAPAEVGLGVGGTGWHRLLEWQPFSASSYVAWPGANTTDSKCLSPFKFKKEAKQTLNQELLLQRGQMQTPVPPLAFCGEARRWLADSTAVGLLGPSSPWKVTMENDPEHLERIQPHCGFGLSQHEIGCLSMGMCMWHKGQKLADVRGENTYWLGVGNTHRPSQTFHNRAICALA